MAVDNNLICGFARIGRYTRGLPSNKKLLKLTSKLTEYFVQLNVATGVLSYYDDDPRCWSKQTEVPPIQQLDVCYMRDIVSSVSVASRDVSFSFIYAGVTYLMKYSMSTCDTLEQLSTVHVDWYQEIASVRSRLLTKLRFNFHSAPIYDEYDTQYRKLASPNEADDYGFNNNGRSRSMTPISGTAAVADNSTTVTTATHSSFASRNFNKLYRTLTSVGRRRNLISADSDIVFSCSPHCKEHTFDFISSLRCYNGEIIRITSAQRLSSHLHVWKSKILVLTAHFIGYYSTKSVAPTDEHFFISRSMDCFKSGAIFSLSSLVSAFLVPIKGATQLTVVCQCLPDVIRFKFSHPSEAEAWCNLLNAALQRQSLSPSAVI